MAVQFNHTIVSAREPRASAEFLADLLGLPAPTRYGPFQVVALTNGVSLDFYPATGTVRSQHYAFLVSEEEFDQIFARIQDRGLMWWADPGHQRPREHNTNDGGRGLYWSDPDGHNMEIITRPYGG
ncbi:VOC family protein [Plantactinospora sp. GCM10030261]|uniref:VOC family protein n=1 Tax=Plantactinospora sp. GCM10030261 TaxID=3273420 RepID=UPI00361D498D